MEKMTLENIQIASPCSVPWDEMEGDHRKRFCGECQLNVFNISEMSRVEAETFLQNSVGTGRVCVTLFKRSDGTILTQDCPVGILAVKRKFRKIVMLVSSLVVTSLVGIGLYQKVSKRGGFRSSVFKFNFFEKVKPTSRQIAGEMIYIAPTPATTTTSTTTTTNKGTMCPPEELVAPEEIISPLEVPVEFPIAEKIVSPK